MRRESLLAVRPVAAALAAGVGTAVAAAIASLPPDGVPPDGKSDRPASRLVIALLAVAIPTLVVAMGPLWWPALSGDEPHYLLYARSIVVDRDIDLGADYDEGSYRSFYPPDLPPHTKPGADPSSRYSTHGIGLPLLLVPWYGVAGGLAVAPFTLLMRFTMALWLGAFALVLFALLRDIAGEKAARRGTLATVLMGPLLFIAPHLFPDLPAMTLSAGAYLILRRSRSPGGAFAAGLLVASLPWLGVKFIAMATALAVVGCLLLLRSTSRPAAVAYVAPIAASALAHVAFTWVLYGRLSPLALYHGGSATGTRAVGQSESLMVYLLDYDGAIRTGIGLLLDQKHGLLLFAPHFLLAVAGFAWLWRRRRPVFWFLLPVFAAHWAAHAVSQELSGWSTPGRPLVGALWTLAIPMGVALALSPAAGRAGGFFAAARGALVALGVGVTALLMVQPHLLYHDFDVSQSLLLTRYGAPACLCGSSSRNGFSSTSPNGSCRSSGWSVPSLRAFLCGAGRFPTVRSRQRPSADLATDTGRPRSWLSWRRSRCCYAALWCRRRGSTSRGPTARSRYGAPTGSSRRPGRRRMGCGYEADTRRRYRYRAPSQSKR